MVIENTARKLSRFIISTTSFYEVVDKIKLGHLKDGLERSETDLLLSASLYEQLNVVLRQAFENSSKHLQKRTNDTVINAGKTLKR